MNQIKIIGISGISGAGKSTLTKALASQLDASSLYWDDFDDISQSPNDYVDWFNRGKNYTEFNYSDLAKSLCDLKQGKSIMHPVTRKTIASTEYIVLDAPLGKAHAQTARYIDTFIHIDIPLDIALARRLIRDTSDNHLGKEDIVESLRQYLHRSRPLFEAEGMCLISNTADYIVDGTQNVESQATSVLDFIKTRHEISNKKNIDISMVDKISVELKKRMRDGFVAFESKKGIDVNYKSFSLVLSLEHEPIGVLNAYTAFSEIYVDDLWIDKAYRGKGYGKGLLYDLEKRFKGKGFNNINLVTSDFQAPEFYKKCGFKAEFKRINEINHKLTKTFFVKFFGEGSQTQGVIIDGN